MKNQQTAHLICNAHLDPVWLWEWPEGAGEALSTFRIAAQFCEEFDGFVFNHNEVILYEWIRKYDPALFKQIQKLVKKGKWHIMGGWYLQPDCNMPSGESFVRQILEGRKFFDKYFNSRPKTAINFDPFGHSRGLVQILAKSGFDSYLFGRPMREDYKLPDETFQWVGYDGSKILAHRFAFPYNSKLGNAKKELEEHLQNSQSQDIIAFLWGVGNHGGGPSKIDLQNLQEFIRENKSKVRIVHSTPENYFSEIKKTGKQFPEHTSDLNPWAVGCYTSQMKIKQAHRRLENEFYTIEKMVTNAWANGLMQYPAQEIKQITHDLLYSEFHDILPGTSIEPAEKASIETICHGLEISSRLKTQAFFALSAGQKQAEDNQIPLLVYNPHPYPVKDLVECNFMTASQGNINIFSDYKVYKDGQLLPSQTEKELSNLSNDWAKRVAFAAEMEPMSINRFDCKCEILDKKPETHIDTTEGKMVFRNNRMKLEINCQTGLIDKYEVDGTGMLCAGAFRPVVLQDNEDPWGMIKNHFDRQSRPLALLNEEESAKFSGTRKKKLAPVRLIEQGPLRDVVEATFGYENTRICQRYKIPRNGTEIEIELIIHCNAFNKMLKLEVPTALQESQFIGQTAYGRQNLPQDGTEAVSQRWLGLVSQSQQKALTIINDSVYGSDFNENILRISLLRTPGYSAHPLGDHIEIQNDRYNPKSDQGKFTFKFWLNGGELRQMMDTIDRRAQVKSERPFAVCYYPSGKGNAPMPLIKTDAPSVQITALKKAEPSNDYIVRLFEPNGNPSSVKLESPILGKSYEIKLGAFEIKTLKLNRKTGKLTEVNLLEEKPA